MGVSPVCLGGSGWGLTVGAGLAVCGSLATAFSAYLFRWGSALAERITRDVGGAPVGDVVSLEMFCVAVGVVATDLFSVVLNGVVGLAFRESAGVTVLLAGVILGFFVYALGSMCWRVSNLVTGNLGVNAMGYGSPLVALVLLWAFSQAEVSRPVLLAAEAVAVVASNLLINFESDVRRVFRLVGSVS